MEQDKNKDTKKSTTDPQQDEIDGNVFGPAFEKLVGNADGENSVSEEEAKEPKKDESIKDS